MESAYAVPLRNPGLVDHYWYLLPRIMNLRDHGEVQVGARIRENHLHVIG